MYMVVDIVLVSRPAPAVIVGLQFIIATQNERVGKVPSSSTRDRGKLKYER